MAAIALLVAVGLVQVASRAGSREVVSIGPAGVAAPPSAGIGSAAPGSGSGPAASLAPVATASTPPPTLAGAPGPGADAGSPDHPATPGGGADPAAPAAGGPATAPPGGPASTSGPAAPGPGPGSGPAAAPGPDAGVASRSGIRAGGPSPVPLPSATTPSTTRTGSSGAPTGPQCHHADLIPLGRYAVINDLWGTLSRLVGGSQCIQAGTPAAGTGPGGTIAPGSPVSTPGPAAAGEVSWSTTWSWPADQGQVKSFSAAVFGWHWGWPTSGTGLPVAIAARPGLRTRWDFTVTQPVPGRMDAALDLWFHDVPHPGATDVPTGEIRILLYRTGGGLPAGTRIGTVPAAGATWDVYRTGGRWPELWFVRTENTTSVDLDLAPLLDVAGQSLRLTYLSSVHAGIDVIDGTGRLDTTRFSVTLS